MMVEMKESGVTWVGKIPKHWNFNKAKYHFTNDKYVVGVKSANYNRLALTLKGVIHREKEDNEGLQPNDFNTYQLLKTGELVFKLIDLQNVSTSRVGLAHETGIVSPAYIILHANNDIDPAYAEKFFLMMWHREIFNALGDAGVRSSLNAGDLLNVFIPIPPLDEQNRIADFLDNKCAEIASISAEIQEQIITLEEYKKSVITEAVTKGLNPNAEMKESGAKWIGNIPKTWSVDKFKYHMYRNEIKDKGYLTVLSLYRELGIVPKDSRSDNHNVTSEDTSKYKYVRIGDFVVNKMKAWQGSVAVSDYQGIVSPAYYIYQFKDNSFNRKYFHYLLRACYKDEFRRLSGGIREGQWDLAAYNLESMLIIIPSKEEQNEIVDYLDSKCAEIDGAIKDKQQQLETLEEYKKTLIYEYVTGKKEVA